MRRQLEEENPSCSPIHSLCAHLFSRDSLRANQTAESRSPQWTLNCLVFASRAARQTSVTLVRRKPPPQRESGSMQTPTPHADLQLGPVNLNRRDSARNATLDGRSNGRAVFYAMAQGHRCACTLSE
jgi:hypothetical protein